MYSTATTIAGVCPLTQIYILLHTKESSVTPSAILTVKIAPTSSLRAVFLQTLDRPQSPRFQKPMETIQVQLRVRDLKTLSPCAD